jgi:DNA replication protein DnaC
LPDGKTDYSRVVVCRCSKKDLTRQHFARLQKYSNLGSLTKLTFENIVPEGRSGDPENRHKFTAAFNEARKFAEKPEGWLILIGPAGSGKTHIAAAIANERINKGFSAFFITTADLLDHLRAAFNPSSEMSYDELFDQVRNAPLLVLDDFGSHSATPWAKEKLDQILNHRFNDVLSTVITSDIPVSDMDDTVRARFNDSKISRICVIEEKSNLSSEYEWPPEFKLQKSMTFENFDWHRRNLPAEKQEVLEGAFRLAMDFAKSPEGWRVFVGVTGCGKTHLAAAIVNYRYQARQPALFIVIPEFLDHLRSAFSPESKLSFDRVFERVKKAPLLVLDDFGEQFSTSWAKEKLYQVINYRYNAQLPTVITTRLSIDEIMEQIESTVSSRLIDNQLSTVWNITAPDYRTDATSAQKKSPRRTSRKWD